MGGKNGSRYFSQTIFVAVHTKQKSAEFDGNNGVVFWARSVKDTLEYLRHSAHAVLHRDDNFCCCCYNNWSGRPVGQAGPVDPVGPVEPVGPVGPVGPEGPIGPEGPVGPETLFA